MNFLTGFGLVSGQDFSVESIDTCLSVGINDKRLIKRDPYSLKCGEILHVGDKFTRIGPKGSAGHPPILLDDGWYQQYDGIITCEHFTPRLGTIDYALFSAFNAESGANAIEGIKQTLEKRNKKWGKSLPIFNHYFIAYSTFDGGNFHYWNSCGSGRLVTASLINRFEA